MDYRSLLARSFRRASRVFAAPFALFVFLATLLSGIGNVINRQGSAQDVASVEGGGKLPYEAPSFEVFSGVFSSDALAADEGSM